MSQLEKLLKIDGIERMVNRSLNEIASEMDSYFVIVGQIEADMDIVDKDWGNDRITRTVRDEKILELKKKLENLKIETKEKGLKILKNLKGDYLEYIKPKGEDIVDEDLKLLKSGIKLTEEELQEIANKYNASSNYTMARLIRSYGEEQDFHIYVKEPVDDLFFQRLEDRIRGAVNGVSTSEVLMRTPEHREREFEIFRSQF